MAGWDADFAEWWVVLSGDWKLDPGLADCFQVSMDPAGTVLLFILMLVRYRFLHG